MDNKYLLAIDNGPDHLFHLEDFVLMSGLLRNSNQLVYCTNKT
jgi:hypothetical protein